MKCDMTVMERTGYRKGGKMFPAPTKRSMCCSPPKSGFGKDYGGRKDNPTQIGMRWDVKGANGGR